MVAQQSMLTVLACIFDYVVELYSVSYIKGKNILISR